jgi:transposase
MTNKINPVDFNNQQLYIGLDVHHKHWSVTIKANQIELRRLSMDPDPEKLASYLRTHFPGANCYTVYEAGFCGYWIHRQLEGYGIHSIIASPNEIPTAYKEKEQRDDPRDSRKLARELEKGSLKGIYIPEILQQEMRSLVRLRYQQSRNQARLKNQIKGYLHFYGHKLPEDFHYRQWSAAFIHTLRQLEFSSPIGRRHLDIQLDNLLYARGQLLRTIRSIRQFIKENNFESTIKLLTSVPGIGFITAATLFTELFDIRRFSGFDQLAKYCGVVPSVSTSDTILSASLSRANHPVLREMLVEASWTAVKKDDSLSSAFLVYCKRMSKQRAIIKIAKKLLSRIRYVWTTGKEYEFSVVKVK